MKKILLAGVMALGLAACGGGGKAQLAKACVDSGEDEKMCNCMADVMKANLSKDTFNLAVKAVRDGDMNSPELQTAMSAEFSENPEKAIEFAGKMSSCEAG